MMGGYPLSAIGYRRRNEGTRERRKTWGRWNAASSACRRDLRRSKCTVDEARDARLNDLCQGLPGDLQDGLEALLAARLGIDADAERAAERSRIAQILARGRIASEKEYRFVVSYLERIDNDASARKDVTALEELMHRFST